MGHLAVFLPEETELAIRTSAGRMLLVGTAQIAAKTTRDSQGVAVVTLKKNQTISSVVPADTLELANPHRYRVSTCRTISSPSLSLCAPAVRRLWGGIFFR